MTGRPPALSSRYTRFEPPLDLDADVVICGGVELTKAVAQLDGNGWNLSNTIHSGTYKRGQMFLSLDLNETLELSLGNPLDVNLVRIE